MDRSPLTAAEVKAAIFGHAEFTAFVAAINQIFARWKAANLLRLQGFDRDGHPKQLIEQLAEDLLAMFRAAPLVDAYDVNRATGAFILVDEATNETVGAGMVVGATG